MCHKLPGFEKKNCQKTCGMRQAVSASDKQPRKVAFIGKETQAESLSAASAQ